MKLAFSAFVLSIVAFSLHAAVKDAMRGPALRDVRRLYRKTPALALWKGPPLLAKSRRLGMNGEQLEDASSIARLGGNFTWLSIWF